MPSLAPEARLRWRGLIPQLFAFVVLPLTGLLVIIAFGSLTLHEQAMRALVGERDERAARAAAGALEAQLRQRAQDVQWLAQRVADGVAPEAILATANPVDAAFDGGLAFLKLDGTVLASRSLSGRDSFADSAAQAGLIRLAREAGVAPAFATAFTGSDSSEAVVFVAAARAEVIAVGAFTPASVAAEALASALGPGSEMSAFVLDAEQRLLYQAGTPSTATHLADHPGVAEALRGESGTSYLPSPEGEHVIAYSAVPSLGWALVIEEPWHAVDNPLLRTTQIAPLVLVPVVALALVALWFGWRQIVQPLQALEARAAQLAWGQFEAIEPPVGGIAEVRRLQAELIHLAHKVKAAQQGLRGYIGAITAGQENERRRLARELHDDTLQALIALNQRIQLALADQPTAQPLAELNTLAEQTIANLRRITRALRPMYLEDLGLVAALEMLAREVSEANGLPVEFHCAGSERRLAVESELALYRLAQEAVSNAVRHSQATLVTLSLTYAPAAVTLAVRDDGRGFSVPDSPAEFAPSGHFGLLGMHERAELIGAQLSLESAPNRGTRLQVTLPTQAP